MTGRIRKSVVILAGGLALALPSSGQAAQTIGQTGSSPTNCTGEESYVQKTLVAGPSYSPSAYGVITSWSAFANSQPPNEQVEKLLVLRPDGGSQFTAVAKDEARTFANLNNLNTFTGLRLPIEPNQTIGLFLPGTGSNGPCEFTGSVGDGVGYTPGSPGEPPLNSSLAYSGTDSGNRLNAQAVVEPDTDRDVFGDETQDKCVGTAGTFNGCPNVATITVLKQKGKKPKVSVQVSVPGQGKLSAGSANDATVASASKVQLKPQTLNLTFTTRQTVGLILPLTKSAKKKLSKKGKLNVQVKVAYTPTGGPAGNQFVQTKLRKKKKR